MLIDGTSHVYLTRLMELIFLAHHMYLRDEISNPKRWDFLPSLTAEMGFSQLY